MLFNRNEKGSEELQELTGIWHASSPFSSIKADILSATEDVRRLVGPEVVGKAEEVYEAGSHDGILDAVRLPVACLAMVRHAKLSVLGHEATGRKLKVDENEKTPFEWMIDRDDTALRDRYYKAVDSLYLYLEENEPALWGSSPKKTALSGSIVKSIEDFEAVYPVDGSHYTYYMLQRLVLEEQRRLAKFFGERWEGVASGAETPELMFLARKAAVLGAVATAGKRWSLEVFPLGVARRFSPSYQGNRAGRAATVEEIDRYIARLEEERSETMTEIRAELGGSHPAALLPKNDPDNKFFTTI